MKLDMLAANGTAIRDIQRQLAALDDTITIYERLLRETRELRDKVANQVLPMPVAGDRFYAVLPREDGSMHLVDIQMVEPSPLPKGTDSGK